MSQHTAQKQEPEIADPKKKVKSGAGARFPSGSFYKIAQTAAPVTHPFETEGESKPADPIHFAIVDNGLDAMPQPEIKENESVAAPMTSAKPEPDLTPASVKKHTQDNEPEDEHKLSATFKMNPLVRIRPTFKAKEPQAETEEAAEPLSRAASIRPVETPENVFKSQTEDKIFVKKDAEPQEEELPSFSAKRLKPPVKSAEVVTASEKEVDARIRARLEDKPSLLTRWNRLPATLRYGSIALAIFSLHAGFMYVIGKDDLVQSFQANAPSAVEDAQNENLTAVEDAQNENLIAVEDAQMLNESSVPVQVNEVPVAAITDAAEAAIVAPEARQHQDMPEARQPQGTPEAIAVEPATAETDETTPAQNDIKTVITQSGAAPAPMDKWSAVESTSENAVDEGELYRLINRR